MAHDEWRGSPPESDPKQDAMKADTRERRERQQGYADLREKIIYALAKEHMSGAAGDYELYGAGAKEELSPLEYKGALRAIGPDDSELAEKFIRTIQRLAQEDGYTVEMDRPPSVTHAFGKTIRKGIPNIIQNRPVLYIYRKYVTGWPTSFERRQAEEAGLSSAEVNRLWGSTRFYENRVSQVASEITEDPHDFAPNLHDQAASQICATTEFKVIREEISDAIDRGMNLQRAIYMPLQIGDTKLMIYFLAEAKHGDMLIDIIGCPPDIKEKALATISKVMIS